MQENRAVQQFMGGNVSKLPDTPDPKQDIYLDALRGCLIRLPEGVTTELGRKTVVHVPGDVPVVIPNYAESVIVLTDSMRRWSRDARVGAIALSFAQVFSGEIEYEAIAALARSWGFEKEVKAALRKVDL